jgi:hypothetical protein
MCLTHHREAAIITHVAAIARATKAVVAVIIIITTGTTFSKVSNTKW